MPAFGMTDAAVAVAELNILVYSNFSQQTYLCLASDALEGTIILNLLPVLNFA
jgi:hypothetical protein